MVKDIKYIRFLILFLFTFLTFSFLGTTPAKADCIDAINVFQCFNEGRIVCLGGGGAKISCCSTQCPVNAAVNGDMLNFMCSLQTAQPNTPWYEPGLCNFSDKVSDTKNPQEIFGERYTFAQVNWITNSLVITALHTIQYFLTLGSKGLTSQIPMENSLASSIQVFYSQAKSRPSFISEFMGQMEKMSISTPVQAQGGGYGYQSLEGVRTIWSASRNSAFTLMILLLVVAGFAVMFRVKMNPQTAVSLQLMIPKLIITLIAITFSYAIAGFVIDMTFIVLNFLIYVLQSAGVVENATAAITFFNGPNLFNISWYFVINILGTAVNLGINSGSNIPGSILGAGVGFIGGAILTVIMAIILMFLLIKIYWLMAKTFVSMIIKIIFAPWQILLGLIPGNSQGLFPWLKSLIADASVFAVIPFMFIMSMTFMAGESVFGQMIGWLNLLNGNNMNLNTGVRTSYITLLPNMPLFGSIAGPIINILIGFVFLTLIPKTAEMIQTALKTSGFKYGSAIGEALGPLGVITRPAGTIAQDAVSTAWENSRLGRRITQATTPAAPTTTPATGSV